MFLAMKLQTSGVYISQHPCGVFFTSKHSIHAREVILHTSKMNRVFGSLHPHTVGAGQDLATVQDAIARKRAAPEIPFDLKTPERIGCKSQRPPGKNT